MALIKCPECQNLISDKAAICPHCGLPAEYFNTPSATSAPFESDIDYKSIKSCLTQLPATKRSNYVTKRSKELRNDRKRKM